MVKIYLVVSKNINKHTSKDIACTLKHSSTCTQQYKIYMSKNKLSTKEIHL